jgi:hypothetical protein
MTETKNPFVPNITAAELAVGDHFYAEERKRQCGYVNRTYTTYNSYRIVSLKPTGTGSIIFQLVDSAGNRTAKSYRAAYAKLEHFTPSDEAKAILWV